MYALARLLWRSFAFRRTTPKVLGSNVAALFFMDEQGMAGGGECRRGNPASKPQQTDGRVHLRITWASQEFRGLEAALTLTPTSCGGALPTRTEKGPVRFSVPRPPPPPPINHSVLGFLPHCLDCKQLRIQEDGPPSCAHLRWGRRLLSANSLSA